mmetsp:Transcript_63657/g.118304  ORF Transcript_63657/g.118304 Transcript_63657/m.118304 type:complete len:219 (+) Transcript_63657:135-791(+)
MCANSIQHPAADATKCLHDVRPRRKADGHRKIQAAFLSKLINRKLLILPNTEQNSVTPWSFCVCMMFMLMDLRFDSCSNALPTSANDVNFEHPMMSNVNMFKLTRLPIAAPMASSDSRLAQSLKQSLRQRSLSSPFNPVPTSVTDSREVHPVKSSVRTRSSCRVQSPSPKPSKPRKFKQPVRSSSRMRKLLRKAKPSPKPAKVGKTLHHSKLIVRCSK